MLFSPRAQSLETPKDPTRNLWKGGGLIAVFLATIIIGNFCISPERAVSGKMLGHDFLPFYFAGNCFDTGHTERLYDLNAAREFERSVGKSANLDIGPAFGPWWNPPFAALLFAPFALLSYRKAQLLWWLFSVSCLSAALTLLCRMLKGGWKIQMLVPLFVLTSMPFYQALSHGQNTFFSLLLLSITVTLWRSERPLLAGLVCGLLFYKPQLGAVVAGVLCLCEGRRAILGLAITGVSLLAVNLIVLPGTLHEWLVQMPKNLTFMQEMNHYRWERHVTFNGFWRLAIQGWENGPTSLTVKWLWALCEIPLGGALAYSIFKTLRDGITPASRDRLIAATIVCMPLLMPFYFDYDLLLATVAITVYAADRQRMTDFPNWEDGWLLKDLGSMLVTLLFATILAGHIRFLITVPLLATAAVLLLRRSLRPAPRMIILSEDEPVLLAA